MYIATIPNRNSPPAILLRESYRDRQGKVKNRTLANLSHLPAEAIEVLRAALKGQKLVPAEEAVRIRRSLPHGHVAAVLGTLRKVGLERLLGAGRSRRRDLAVAMIVARILQPRSKLATARGLDPQSASDSLGEVLGLGSADADELYEAMDWLLKQQAKIERALAERHLRDGTLVLYDLTSTYFEGRTCPLAQFGFPHDGQWGKLQIVFGLLCNAEGCPVAVEVFAGNTADAKTVAQQIVKLRDRFRLTRIVLVGDRGMLTAARIREDLEPAGFVQWITALRAPTIQRLAREGSIQRSLFDEQDLAEIRDPAFPGERLIACRNPLLAEERRRKRDDLLAATQRQLDQIVAATRRAKRPLRGQAKIALRVGRVLGRYKMAKHFRLEISDTSLSYQRDPESIQAEAVLDGVYVIRTNVPPEAMGPDDAVRQYKGLSKVERAFRSMKSVDLKVRPIHHRLADRVRAHVFLCMLAYYVEWHLRRALAPLLFDDDDPASAQAQRTSVVAPAKRSPHAEQKAHTQRTADGLPVQSFQTLLAHLATLTRNEVHYPAHEAIHFTQYPDPTPLQQRAFELLAVSPRL